MNRLLIGFGLAGCLLGWPNSAIAQVMNFGVPPRNQPIRDPAGHALTYGSSADLQTQPRTSQGINLAPALPASGQTPNLEAIAGSVQAKPGERDPLSVIPEIIRPSPRDTSVQPLDYFRPPGPSGGLKVRLGQ